MKNVVCRSCGHKGLGPILSLGSTPLANALLTREQLDKPEATYPLELAFCPACTLVQITENVPPEQMFGEYVYFSSFSDTLVAHAKTLSEKLIVKEKLGPQSLVMEIASNDGYLLQHYHQKKVPVLGIEPAKNIAQHAEKERGIPTLCEFFSLSLAKKLASEGRKADLLHAHNVLAHVPDLNGFVGGIKQVLKPEGLAVLEVPYVKDLIEKVEFDTIYHEHFSYFSITSLNHLFHRHSLALFDVEFLPIHGGSLRLYVGHQGAKRHTESVKLNIQNLLAEEKKWGVGDFKFYATLAQHYERLKKDLLVLLQKLKREDKKLAAYGASAKGSTLLNCFGIGREMLDFVVDRSPHKQGLFTPGKHLPIYAPEKLLEEKPDYVLLLTWNFAAEIISQQKEYLKRQGHFIIPIPEVRIEPKG